jgi:hypothetical protein
LTYVNPNSGGTQWQPEQPKQLGVQTPREQDFSKDDVRGWAQKILASMATLSRAERARVLAHAQKVNAV